MKNIRIGMVCPYGWDTPGGVQTHIRDLAEHLIEEGHFVSVLTPISDDSVMVSTSQLKSLLENNYLSTINKIKTVGSDVMHKEINSVFF